jgi:hypothetical protein
VSHRRAGTVATLLLLAAVSPAQGRDSDAEAAALAVLDAFMAAVNARDVEAFEAQLHFPHYRFASGAVAVVERAGTRPDLFERFAAATPGWHHSAWERRDVIHSGPSKVHIDTRFVRYRADGSVLSRFDSLYIVTRQDGRWAVEARSSFAP